MILLNEKPIIPKHFPDGTYASHVNGADLLSNLDASANITWKYDGDDECFHLWCIVNHLRNMTHNEIPIKLYLPYIPHARMDRVHYPDEIFTLKWFADLINSMNFHSVTVLDPHSNVSSALLNRVRVLNAGAYIRNALTLLSEKGKTNLLLCYPDEGAAKRYADLMCMDYVFGIKHRDWRTGKIRNLELTTPEKIAGRDILIVDDICSRGGTFTYTAKALKDAGAKSITLYVTHCENTIHEGTVLSDGLIEHVYTTDSIYRGEHEKITIL